MLSVYTASVEVEIHAVRYRSVESVNSLTLTSAWLHTRQNQMLLDRIHSRRRRAELSIIPTAANSSVEEKNLKRIRWNRSGNRFWLVYVTFA